MLRVLTDVLFLAGLASVVWVLDESPHPHACGARPRRPSRPARRIRGAPIGSEPATAAANPVSRDGLAPLGALGRAVVASEPAWLLAGVAILSWRFTRSSGRQRRELLAPLLGIVLLGVLLVTVVATWAGGATVNLSVPLFLLGLAVFPVVMLFGISGQARRLASDLAASRRRLAAAEDEARRTLERDLHDGVQQQLMAILSLAELTSRQMSRDRPAALATLADLSSQTRDAVAELRDLVSGIRPPVLADSGVAAALESRLSRLAVHLDADGASDTRWPGGIEAAAYFVACEAVTNALKHAPGADVHVVLRGDESELLVEVRDDGPGIPPAGLRLPSVDTDSQHETNATPVGSNGSGLDGLRDRVDSWGGTLAVEPGATGGTVVRARFPVGTPQ